MTQKSDENHKYEYEKPITGQYSPTSIGPLQNMGGGFANEMYFEKYHPPEPDRSRFETLYLFLVPVFVILMIIDLEKGFYSLLLSFILLILIGQIIRKQARKKFELDANSTSDSM